MTSFVSIVLFITILSHLSCAQYYPHRRPATKLILSSHNLDTDSQNTNPFARAYEDQGYMHKFSDYGRQRYQPVPELPKKMNKVKKERQEKIEFDYFEGSDEEYKSPNLDYNDDLGFKDFDPFKFVQEGVKGIDKLTDLGGLDTHLASLGDDANDYNYNYGDK